MLDKNQAVMSEILTVSMKKLHAVINQDDNETAYDFLAWVYESIDQAQTDYSADVEGPEDIIDLLLTFAEHFEPSDDTRNYQWRLQRKRERYWELAEKRESESAATFAEARRMQSVIPFGQPILVGHHSEKWDRRYRDRIWSKLGKGVELASTAKYHAARAARVGKGGISGDDPNAVIKLRRKLALAEKLQQRMKDANKIAKSKRKGYTDEQKVKDLQAQGYTLEQSYKIMAPDFAGRIGFPAYALSNNNAEIKRIRQRIDEEIANAEARNTPDADYTMPNGDIVTVEFDGEDNRIRLHFPGKPQPEVRSVLKRNGFRWSRYNGAWQRQNTANARAVLDYVLRQLEMEPA